MSKEVNSVVGLRDLFSDPEKVWVVMATQSVFRPLIMKNHLGVKNVLMMSSGFEEDLPKEKYKLVGEYCSDTAENKARLVAKTVFSAKDKESKQKVKSLLQSPFQELDKNFDVDKVQVVIGADTVVEKDGLIFEKPKDREDAKRQISSYSEQWHEVHTGYAIFVRNKGFEKPAKKAFTTTKVRFQKMTDEDVEALLDTGEYKGSSGSYKVTGMSESLVQEFVGSYTNVIGLPSHSVSLALSELAKTNNFFKS